MDNNEVKLFAQKLAFALSSPEVSKDTKYALEDVYHKAFEYGDVGVITEPEVVKVLYPLIIESSNHAYHNSLKAIYSTMYDRTPNYDDSQFDEPDSENAEAIEYIY